MATHNLTGYGPRSRLIFDGDERRYESWEAKFYGYLHTLKLKKELEKDVPDAGNRTIYCNAHAHRYDLEILWWLSSSNRFSV